MKGGRFVGRAAAIAQLTDALEAAEAGRSGVVLVSGDAGIGKTRLITEASELARGRGFAVLTGRCVDVVGPVIPYLPIADLLRAVPDSPAYGTSGDAQLSFFTGVRSALERLAQADPLLVVLEDLHWADDSTLNLVSFLGRTVEDRRLVIAATYRTGERSGRPRMSELVHDLGRLPSVTTVSLGPLARDDLLAVLHGLAPAPPPDDVLETIATRCEGNPYFAEELLAAVGRGERGVPPAVTAAMLQRVARTGAEAASVVRVAAAAGRDVSYRLLRETVGLAPEQLIEALRDAVDQHVLVPTGSGYRFRHALLAEAVYETLLPGERERVHERLAEALERLGDADATGEAALHWAAADRPVEALTRSRLAAGAARAVSGWAEVLAHLERVVAYFPRVPREVRSDVDLADVLAEAAEAAHLTGNGQRAAELVRQAIELCGAAVSVTRTAVCYERLGSYLLPTGEREQALAALDRAAVLLPADPPTAERARVLATLGNAMRVAMRHEDALQVCTEATALADAVGEASAGFRARDIAHLSLCHLGRAEEGLAGLEQACAQAQKRELPMDVLCPFALRSDALMALGRLAEAAQVAAEGLALARRLGVERGVGTLLAVNAAEARIGLGDWTGADTVLTEALRRGGEFWSHQLHRLRAQLAIGRGEIDAAHRHLAAGAAAALEPRTAAEYAALTAELAMLEGRLDDADAAIDDGIRADPDDLALTHARLCAVGLRVTAGRAVLPRTAGEVPRPAAVDERIRDLLGRARRCARRAAGRSPDVGSWAAVAEAEHGAGQRRTDQPRLWLAAAQAAARVGRSHLIAYCHGRHAGALAAAGAAASDVAIPARVAYRAAVTLGAWPLRHDLEALAREARITLTDPEGRAVKLGPSVPGLSAREEEVLALVARGYTNREIAAELTISVKTASLHVSHILQKLGTRNRTEAAAFARPPSWPG